MLPRALRGSFVEEKSINMAGIVECEMRIALFIYLFIYLFSIFIWINRHQGKEMVKDSTTGAKRNKKSLVSFSGDLCCFCSELDRTGQGNTPEVHTFFNRMILIIP